MKKIVSLVLSFSLLFGLFSINVFAVNENDISANLSAQAPECIDKNIPIVMVNGFGETIYTGLDTLDEADDIAVFPPQSSLFVPSLLKHIPGFLTGLLLNNYDIIDKHIGPFMQEVFSPLSSNPDGTMKKGTGVKIENKVEKKDSFGYENAYVFEIDWRKDMKTLASEFNSYIEKVKEVNNCEKVALAAFSQGNCVLMTYLYDYYYTVKDKTLRNDIKSVLFICGAMNGVASCEDPISGNVSTDSLTLMRFLKVALDANKTTKAIYYFLEMLYSIGAVDWLVNRVNGYLEDRLDDAIDPYLLDTFGGIPGFYALMSPERYQEAEEYIFSTPELKEKYSGLIEKNRYYHNKVQVNSKNIINMLLSDKKNVGIFAEYGYPVAPVTSDNNRMTDFSICTSAESFGATCADYNSTLGEGYIQAVTCTCGKNHISADNQIDASTCLYPDITWFGKNIKHRASNELWGELFNLIVYSEKQTTVWSYSDYPQFLLNQNYQSLVPLTAENSEKLRKYEDTMIFKKLFSKNNYC